ncbi:MAG TPA: acyl carrier protein [Thermodesulfobacteriota bacterium]|jgi:acyl carrier protein|nr:acyl carrier protein [Thermodesulfobacteriota bacterium]
MEEIRNRVKRVLVKKLLKGLNPEDIKDDTPLIELGVGVDSVATLEFILAMEEEFQISIDEGEINMELLANVISISDYISNRIESGSK